jgi:calcineurin-like phosphoesterase
MGNRDLCYHFKNIFAENSAKKIGVLTQNKDKLCKILIITLVVEKNTIFFRRKLSKIAENRDHNIDPSNYILGTKNSTYQHNIVSHQVDVAPETGNGEAGVPLRNLKGL